MSEILKTRLNIEAEYVSMAPLALAFERIMECRILNEQTFERPVLDIGCGEGLFAKILFDGQVDTGIDPNSKELERARELGAYKELVECRGDAIPKQDNAYKTVISNSVIEHIPDIAPVFTEAYRLLAPEGRFFLTVPSNCFDEYTWISQFLLMLGLNGLQKRYSTFFNRFWVHYHFYTPNRWAEIATKAGFKVVEVRTYGPKRVCLMNDLLVPFSALEMATKKLVNRWTLFPRLRRAVLAPFTFIGTQLLKGADRTEAGGLVFLSLQKVD